MVDDTGRENPERNAELDCEAWEAMLADRMDLPDGVFAPEEEAAFVAHSLLCPGCGELLEQARQGQQWLKLLEGHAPAAPVHLLSKILAKTQGAGHESDFAVGTGVAAGLVSLPGHLGGRWGIPFLPGQVAAARGAHNARMLMTAGMAFFSVALTLSVAGVRLTSVHAAELRPQAVQANVSRSFYGTKKQVVSFYENLRLVYEVESKMHELRGDTVGEPARPSAAPSVTHAVPAVKAPAGGGLGSPAKSGASGGGAAAKPGGHASGLAPGAVRSRPAEEVERGWPLAAGLQTAAGSRNAFTRASFHLSTGSTRTVTPRTLLGATSKERNRT